MSYENVKTEMDGDLLIVTLHRPESLNAMTHEMRVDLLDCVRGAEADDAVKAIVFTGHGDKAFCAGANIPELYGTYIFGDYCTGRIWSFQLKEKKRVNFQNLRSKLKKTSKDVPLFISSFGEDNSGELYVVDYLGVIYKFVPY